MMAGLWPLCECHITGCFELRWIVALLPSSVQHLHIDLDYLYRDQRGIMRLSNFNKFKQLHSLSVKFTNAETADGPEVVTRPCFSLNGMARLMKLKSLHLTPFCLISIVRGIPKFAPLLTSVDAHVPVWQTQSYVNLPSIRHLCLRLCKATSGYFRFLE